MDNHDTEDEINFKQDQIENRIIANGNLVEAGVKSEFWQEIVGPEIYKLICASGSYQKPDGTWITTQSMSRTSVQNERTFDAGYQSGLMELSNNLLAFIKMKDNVVKQRAKSKDESKEELITPMTEQDEL